MFQDATEEQEEEEEGEDMEMAAESMERKEGEEENDVRMELENIEDNVRHLDSHRDSPLPDSRSMSSSTSTAVLFQPSLAPLGGYQGGLGTPKKSLLAVAASCDADSFKKEYSPSMMSPVVQGMSPFAARNEVQVKAQYQRGDDSGRIASSPSLRSRTAVLKTRKGSKLRSEVSTDTNFLFDKRGW